MLTTGSERMVYKAAKEYTLLCNMQDILRDARGCQFCGVDRTVWIFALAHGGGVALMLLTETDIRRSVTGTHPATDLSIHTYDAEQSVSHTIPHTCLGVIAPYRESRSTFGHALAGLAMCDFSVYYKRMFLRWPSHDKTLRLQCSSPCHQHAGQSAAVSNLLCLQVPSMRMESTLFQTGL